MFLSVVIFLIIMTALQRIGLPERPALTLDDIRVIEEIRKITRHAQPAIEKPSAAEPKPIKPQKRLVTEQIQTRLSELRKQQAVNNVRQKKVIDRANPKIGMKNPPPGMIDRERTHREENKPSIDRLLSKTKTQQTETKGPVILVAKGTDPGDDINDSGSIRDEIYTRTSIGSDSGVEGEGDIPTIPISPSVISESDSGDDISDILHPLIAWMLKNPAEFTPVEKKFLDFVPGDLISRAHFTMENETFDLLLLLKRASTELRISLRQGNEVILLIDQGLQERSNYLREGEASTDAAGRVIAFGTSQKSASEEATKYFYQVFVSWWDWVQGS